MSAERSRRLAVQALAAIGFLLGLLCFREAGKRSLFTESVDGRVVQVETLTEKHPGRDDRHYITIEVASGRRRLEVDAAVAAHLGEGMHVVSGAGRDGLLVDGRRVHVKFSDDTVLLGLALWVGLLVAPLLELLSRSRARSPART